MKNKAMVETHTERERVKTKKSKKEKLFLMKITGKKCLEMKWKIHWHYMKRVFPVFTNKIYKQMFTFT